MVASAGITLGEKTGLFSTLRWRYISSRPLTEDGVFQSPPVNTINGRVGYQFTNGWRIQLDALNLLNSSSYNASYAYGALLQSDALFAKCFPSSGAPTVPAAVCQNGFMDYSIHPLDSLAVRLTLAGPIDSIDIPRMVGEFRRALPTYQPPAPNYDWTGFYVGAYVGNNWLKSNSSAVNNVTAATFPTAGGNTSQWGGGVQLGFDYMLPSRVVLGLSGRHFIRRHQDGDGLRPLRHEREPDNGVRQRDGPRPDRLRRRQYLVLHDGRLCLVQCPVCPHAVNRYTQ